MALWRVVGLTCAADFFGGSHRFERARDDLRSPGPSHVVGGFGFEQLRVREDNAELIVQTVEEEAQCWRFVHGSSRKQFLDAQRAPHPA